MADGRASVEASTSRKLNISTDEDFPDGATE
jgi:hypothetical protein